MIHRHRHAKLSPSTGNVSVSRVDLCRVAPVQILSRGGKCVSHLCCELHCRGHSRFAVVNARHHDASGASHRQHFVDNVLHQLFCVGILCDFPITRVSQCGDRV